MHGCVISVTPNYYTASPKWTKVCNQSDFAQAERRLIQAGTLRGQISLSKIFPGQSK
jgi:hypothetical protein